MVYGFPELFLQAKVTLAQCVLSGRPAGKDTEEIRGNLGTLLRRPSPPIRLILLDGRWDAALLPEWKAWLRTWRSVADEAQHCRSTGASACDAATLASWQWRAVASGHSSSRESCCATDWFMLELGWWPVGPGACSYGASDVTRSSS